MRSLLSVFVLCVAVLTCAAPSALATGGGGAGGGTTCDSAVVACDVLALSAGITANLEGPAVNVTGYDAVAVGAPVVTITGAITIGGESVSIASTGTAGVQASGNATLTSVAGNVQIGAAQGLVRTTSPIQIAAPQYTPSPPPTGAVNLYVDANTGNLVRQKPDGSTATW